MKKTTVLWVAVGILFLLNMGTLLFILNRRVTPHHQGPDPDGGRRQFDELVINTLQLNPEQIDRFNHMKHRHHEQMLELDRATKQPFEQYFGLLTQSANNVAKDSLEKLLTGLYAKRMQITYDHFAELKAICTQKQQQKFNQLIPSLMQVMTNEEKKPPHHRRKME